MEIKKNILIEGKHQKPILVDVFHNNDNGKKPVIIFCHGYKGFKDWGAWNLMAESFTKKGYCFIKFNFSHNGGTATQPYDFPDLEAFGNNNYIKELDDLDTVITWVYNTKLLDTIIDKSNISLIGHSRGGGIACIKSEEDQRIKQLVCLASVSDFKSRFPNVVELQLWKENGVMYVLNGRTKQQMPHYYQFYTNFLENEHRLTIQRAVSNLKIPQLIIHGNADSSVSISEAEKLHTWNPKSKLLILKNSNHVFGASHPWNQKQLPNDLTTIVEQIILFLKK